MNEPESQAFGFERLEVWHKAVAFAGSVYKSTASFPRAEQFGLAMQLRRASVSVAANIAEGASRASGKDQARFFEIAFGSLNEIATMLHIALGQAFIKDGEFARMRSEISDMARMLSGLKRVALARRS